MQKLKNHLIGNYIITLTAVTIVIAIIHFTTNELSFGEWFKQSSANLFTTILGIWVTVFCIDRIIKKKEQREKDRLRDIAYREIHRAINFYLFYIDYIYRASSENMPEFKSTFKEMYNSNHFKEAFLNCDFRKIISFQNCSWGHYIDYQTKDFIKIIEKTISKYSFILDSDTLAQIETLKGATFCLMSSQMENPDGKREVIYKYFSEFLNQLFYILDNIFFITGNPKYSLHYENFMWLEDSSDIEKIGSARFNK